MATPPPSGSGCHQCFDSVLHEAGPCGVRELEKLRLFTYVSYLLITFPFISWRSAFSGPGASVLGNLYIRWPYLRRQLSRGLVTPTPIPTCSVCLPMHSASLSL